MVDSAGLAAAPASKHTALRPRLAKKKKKELQYITEIPIKPMRVVDFLCVGHTEKNCKECSVWVEQTLGWRVYEWNYLRRDFVSEFRNSGWPPIPTLHGRVDKCEDKESKDIAPETGLELVLSSQAGPADNTRKRKWEREDSEEDTIYLGTAKKRCA
jgi:hypothetical protein